MSKPMSKPAAKAAPKAAAKAAPAPRRDAAKKEPPKPVKVAPKAKAAPPAKAAPVSKAPQPPKSAAKAAPPLKAKAVPKAPEKAKKAEAKPSAPVKPAPVAKGKVDPKAKAAPVADAKAVKGKKPEPAKVDPKAAKAKVAAEKPAPAPKPVKEKAVKAPKPPKLAPVAAAFAKPPPAKPLAVAAGRAQPVTRLTAPTPMRSAPKPLTAPKPVSEPELVGDSQPVPAFKAKAPDKKGMILVGAIGGAFGVKGEVRLRAFTEKKVGIVAYGPLYGEDGKIMLRPKSWRELKDGVAVVAAEVKSKEQADAMKGQRLFVPRSNLPPTAEDEYYVVDLLGSRAEALDGTVLGDIVAVWNFGAGDIVEYKPPNGGPNVRMTFSKQAVPHVDLAAKRVVLDPPPPEPEGK
ncbi:MAG: ribosome maturation factor RimM [Vitreimonas sp.]